MTTHQSGVAEELLTINEVSAIFRVDPSSTRRWIQNGALEAVFLPSKSKRRGYRIRRSDLERILNSSSEEQD